ncbi:MazG nucleotide pyrophosphohydrolase domain-containing protein [Streptomyces sp. NPDC006631]|uniref:MazG nucleotide pyrophosphohydrolase domain-containing protein n=1 Tax=Streptomyces sp. NPDC006631 TaxID=3364752 RepID=UPI0036A15D95
MDAVRQWHEAAGEARFVERGDAERDQLIALRTALISEEVREVLEALRNYAVTKMMDDHFESHPEMTILGLHVVEAPRWYEALAKELADVLYVVYGTADLLEIPLEAVFAEVHRSNMTKVVDGQVIRREDGKILKPDSYKEADVHGALTGEWL